MRHLITRAFWPAGSWTVQRYILFHMYNLNGAVGRRSKLDDLVRRAVACRQVPESWLAIHGPLNSYNRDALSALLNGGATRKQARVVVTMIEQEIRAGYEELEKIISENA
jgi:hypothetical protein